MAECPICKNTIGFVFGTCCNCGYNRMSHEFKTIEVDVEDLMLLGVCNNDINDLINIHYHRKYKKEG